jgi:hypothetical protein
MVLAFADHAHATFALQVHPLHRVGRCVEPAADSAGGSRQAGGLRRLQGDRNNHISPSVAITEDPVKVSRLCSMFLLPFDA